MTIARANLSVVTLRSRLFAIGGFSGKKFLSSLEWLDLEDMEWMVQSPRLAAEEDVRENGDKKKKKFGEKDGNEAGDESSSDE